MMATRVLPLASLALTGAIFGFFYAWVCSTMWGLDASEPYVAIAAMQAMNASVRNLVFFPAFFLTPAMLGITALALVRAGRAGAAIWFGLAAGIYCIGGIGVTAAIHVPMNEALALTPPPADAAAAEMLWHSYSTRWQGWNALRTVASGAALLMTGLGLIEIGPGRTIPA